MPRISVRSLPATAGADLTPDVIVSAPSPFLASANPASASVGISGERFVEPGTEAPEPILRGAVWIHTRSTQRSWCANNLEADRLEGSTRPTAMHWRGHHCNASPTSGVGDLFHLQRFRSRGGNRVDKENRRLTTCQSGNPGEIRRIRDDAPSELSAFARDHQSFCDTLPLQLNRAYQAIERFAARETVGRNPGRQRGNRIQLTGYGIASHQRPGSNADQWRVGYKNTQRGE